MKPNDFKGLRSFVEETVAAQIRRCPKCQGELRLCVHERIGAAIFFPTREEAEKATEIFNEGGQHVVR